MFICHCYKIRYGSLSDAGMRIFTLKQSRKIEKRLAPGIIHRTDGDVTAIYIHPLLKFIFNLFC